MIRKLVGAFIIATIGLAFLPVVGNVASDLPLEVKETTYEEIEAFTFYDVNGLETVKTEEELLNNVTLYNDGTAVIKDGSVQNDYNISDIDGFMRIEDPEGSTFLNVYVESGSDGDGTYEAGEVKYEFEGQPGGETLNNVEFEVTVATSLHRITNIIPFLYALIVVGGVVVYVKYAGLND